MVSFFRTSLASILAFSLIMTGFPMNAALAAPLTTDQWEEIKDAMELMVPVRKKDETVAETYYRLEPRLADSQKREFAELNKKLKYQMPKTKAVEARVTADSLILKDGNQELVIKIEKDKKGEPVITFNGRALTQKQALSPLLTYEFLKTLSVEAKEQKKSAGSWLWHQFIPESHALFGLSNSMLIGGGLVAAALGFIIYKQFFKKEKTCKDKAAVCCNQNNNLVQLENGCCTESGGLESGFTTCPTEMMIDPSTTDSSSSTGTSTGGTQ